MSTKITLTLITIILLVAMTRCNKSSTPIDESSTPSGASQDNQESTKAETTDTGNYQMLPIISGKVAKLHLDASADGTTQQIAVGEVMAISLESNPSTGYSWFATSSKPDVLASMGEPEFQEPTGSATPMLGAPGTETFYFQAAAAGTATLTLDYKRSWESNVTPEKTITIIVEVK